MTIKTTLLVDFQDIRGNFGLPQIFIVAKTRMKSAAGNYGRNYSELKSLACGAKGISFKQDQDTAELKYF